jgi:hypothetical protein
MAEAVVRALERSAMNPVSGELADYIAIANTHYRAAIAERDAAQAALDG